MKTNFVIEEKKDVVHLTYKDFYENGTSVKNHQTFVVKKEFYDSINWNDVNSSMDLFKNTKITDYLHNEEGPAVIDHKHDKVNYFINGKLKFESPKKESK